MEPLPSRTLQEDLKQVVQDESLPWEKLRDASILITGATGLVGSALARVLRAVSASHGFQLRITSMGRNPEKLKRLAAECGVDAVICGDIRFPFSEKELPDKVDYIFHCPAVTKSSEMVAKPADVITTAVEGTRNVLDLAKARPCKGVVYLSSMEVYGQLKISEARETDLGYLDLSLPRSSYPESKRLCESLCTAYNKQHGVPVKIARLAQTFGAGTPKEDTRVFGQFARSAECGQDIILHTEGRSRGNYCYITDTVRGLITILLKGEVGEAYNVANPQASATIREMAELVAREICGRGIKVRVEPSMEPEKQGYMAEVGYRLNADKLMRLGWKPRVGLKEMYIRLLRDWNDE